MEPFACQLVHVGQGNDASMALSDVVVHARGAREVSGSIPFRQAMAQCITMALRFEPYMHACIWALLYYTGIPVHYGSWGTCLEAA